MKGRLTLTIDPQILHQAKQVARQRKASLSSLVERLLRDATAGGSPEAAAVTTFSQRWQGKLKIERRDEPRFERLAGKYGVK